PTCKTSNSSLCIWKITLNLPCLSLYISFFPLSWVMFKPKKSLESKRTINRLNVVLCSFGSFAIAFWSLFIIHCSDDVLDWYTTLFNFSKIYDCFPSLFFVDRGQLENRF